MGRAAKGTVLQIGDGAATEVFSSINEVRDISGGGLTQDTDDTTHHGSTIEEVVPTIVRTQEVTFTVNHNPRHATHGATGATSLRQALLDQLSRNFRLYTPAATDTGAADLLAFTGYVTAYSLAEPVTGALTADITIKPIGPTAATYSTATGLP